MTRGLLMCDRATGDLAQRFLIWLLDDVEANRLTVNRPRSPLHIVPEGLLLVSPKVFQLFIHHGGIARDTPFGTVQKQFQRQRWHLKAQNGGNIHTYQVVNDRSGPAKRRGRPQRLVHGFVIPPPKDLSGEKSFADLPVNRALTSVHT